MATYRISIFSHRPGWENTVEDVEAILQVEKGVFLDHIDRRRARMGTVSFELTTNEEISLDALHGHDGVQCIQRLPG